MIMITTEEERGGGKGTAEERVNTLGWWVGGWVGRAGEVAEC